MFNKDIEKLNFIVENISNIEEVIKRHDDIKEALKEVESKKILQSIQSGLDDIKNGKTNPIDKLWDELWILNIQIIF